MNIGPKKEQLTQRSKRAPADTEGCGMFSPCTSPRLAQSTASLLEEDASQHFRLSTTKHGTGDNKQGKRIRKEKIT